jgi:cytochrome bd-type quinol oxidase subunit 2
LAYLTIKGKKMEEQINSEKPIEIGTAYNLSNNPYGIDNKLIDTLAKRMKIIMGIMIASIALSIISTILVLASSESSSYYSRNAMQGISTITTVVGLLIGLGISIAYIVFLNKSSNAFNIFNQTGDIRDLNDGFYHQNRYFNLTKAIIIIALGIGGIALIISLIGLISRI